MIKICKKHGPTEGYIDGSKGRKNDYVRCKKCRSNGETRFRRKRKRDLVEHFGGACIRCGYNPIADSSKSLAAIEFHHRDPEEKEFGLGYKGMSHGWEKCVKEAEKCDMVCANCHRELHYNESEEH
jgi:hypothetical protein